jgi:catechol 2,3-dioxygenase-like lactoylglutathione lyase family enzyme
MVRRVNHTGISVSDMERSLAFYRDVLGLRLVMDLDVDRHPGLDEVVGMQDAVGRVVFLRAGDTLVELWCYAEPEGRPLPPTHRPADRGVTHVAFEVDDVDAVHQAVTQAGYRANSAPVDLGLHKTCYVRGPDGEFVELLEDRTNDAMLERVTARTLAARRARGGSHGRTRADAPSGALQRVEDGDRAP